MKKGIILLLTGLLSFPAFAGPDKQISVEKLPVKSREFIAQYFADAKISLATVDKELFDTTYEVFFTNGNKLEFAKNGDWKEMDCKYSQVNENALPSPIRSYIQTNHAGQSVKEIDRDSHSYEVKLDNGMELIFDLKFNFRGYDH